MELYITSRNVTGEDGRSHCFQYFLVVDQVDSGSWRKTA